MRQRRATQIQATVTLGQHWDDQDKLGLVEKMEGHSENTGGC